MECVYPAIRTVGIEAQQHLSLRAAVEEQNRRVRLEGGFAWQEQLRVRFLAILRRKGHGLGHDELGTREGGRDGFRSEPPPLPPALNATGCSGWLPSLCNAKSVPSAPICGKSSMAWLWAVRTAEPCSASTVQICILSVSS